MTAVTILPLLVFAASCLVPIGIAASFVAADRRRSRIERAKRRHRSDLERETRIPLLDLIQDAEQQAIDELRRNPEGWV